MDTEKDIRGRVDQQFILGGNSDCWGTSTPTPAEEVKTCSKCNDPKSVSEFYKTTRTKDGRMNICKDCDYAKKKGYRQAKSEKQRVEFAATQATCTRCHATQSLINFYQRSDGSIDTAGCKVCMDQKTRTRELQYRRNFGITLVDYDTMFARQNGQCAICWTNKANAQDDHFHIDHDHSTGQVRGLLCKDCNNGLGHFKDDPVLTQLATNYLQQSRTQCSVSRSC